MTRKPDTRYDPGIAPLSTVEQYRLDTALDAVSTRTLLASLLEIERDNEDARLIIKTLLDRVRPADELSVDAPSLTAGS